MALESYGVDASYWFRKFLVILYDLRAAFKNDVHYFIVRAANVFYCCFQTINQNDPNKILLERYERGATHLYRIVLPNPYGLKPILEV
jgi:hypothetical protein